MDAQTFARAFWRDVVRQDATALTAYFLPEAQIRWHCTNERFSVTEYVRANCEYPGDWAGEVERVECAGGVLITATRVWLTDSGASFHATSFFRMAGGKIAELDEYWGDDGAAPEWRRSMEIGVSIGEK